MTSIVDAAQYLFTSESVTEGHPDKLCDQVSDAILDAILRDDPMARVACETATTTGTVYVLGEITTTTYVEFQNVVRETVREIGYTDARYGFDYRTCGTIVSVHEQSPDIKRGVDESLETRGGHGDGHDQGAGDQGMMFGFACRETPGADAAAHRPGAPHGAAPGRGPQGRRCSTTSGPTARRRSPSSTPTGSRSRCAPSSLASQHDDEVSEDRLRDDLIEAVVHDVVPANLRARSTRSSTSTRPVASSSAARWATRA